MQQRQIELERIISYSKKAPYAFIHLTDLEKYLESGLLKLKINLTEINEKNKKIYCMKYNEKDKTIILEPLKNANNKCFKARLYKQTINIKKQDKTYTYKNYYRLSLSYKFMKILGFPRNVKVLFNDDKILIKLLD